MRVRVGVGVRDRVVVTVRGARAEEEWRDRRLVLHEGAGQSVLAHLVRVRARIRVRVRVRARVRVRVRAGHQPHARTQLAQGALQPPRPIEGA